MDKISFISTSYNGNFFIAAEHKYKVHIWDAANLSLKSSFDTIFDSYDEFIINFDGSVCILPAYHVDGVAAYNTDNGKLLWQRKDFKKARKMSFDLNCDYVYIGFDDKPLHVIELATGNTVSTLRGSRCKIESPFNDVYLIEKTQFELYSKNHKKISKISRQTFSSLDMVFGENAFFLTESTGSIRAISIYNAAEIWNFTPVTGSHFLHVGYNPTQKTLFGILWSYEKGGPKTLYSFDAQNGNVLNIMVIDDTPSDLSFAKMGSILITNTGYIYDLSVPGKPKILTKVNF